MQRLGVGRNDLDPEAICLAKELGALPLALEQAAAYIFHLILKITLTDIKQLSFVWLLKQQHATALSLDAQHRFTQPGWWTSNMSKKGHLPLQRLCAFQLFSSLNVFLSMSSILDLLNSIRRNWEKVSFSYSDTGDILKILSNYSLFTVDHQCKLFRVHKLVQEVVRESLTESERRKTFVECVRALRLAFLQFFCIRELKVRQPLRIGRRRPT